MLKGKRVLITGASRGIGFETARAFAAAGARVAICSRSQDNIRAALEQLAAEFPGADLFATTCDMADPEQVNALVDAATQHFGGLDTLVNNAAFATMGAPGELAASDWQAMLDANLTGAFAATQRALPHLLANDGETRGVIIDVGSISAHKFVRGNVGYAASKAALETMSSYLFGEYRKQGICVTHLSIGSVNTTFSLRNPDTIGWKIRPEEVAQTIASVADLAYRMPNACVTSLTLQTKRPLETTADKE